MESVVQGKVLELWTQFVKGGYKAIYIPIFGTPQFPVWFVVQATWACYVVHRSCLRKPKGFFMWIRQAILAFAMTFAPREIMALVLRKQSPIAHNPISVGIFAAIFVVLTLCPYNIAYKILSFLYPVIGFLQGYNQTRLFTLCLRSLKGFANVQTVPIALGFTVSDQIIEFMLRPLFSGVETKMSNPGTIFTTCVSATVFWLGTHENQFTESIGLYPIQIPALVLGLILGISNAISIFGQTDEEEAEIRRLRRQTAPPTPSKPATPMYKAE